MAGCVENELGLRQFLEERGHTYVVTADKEGEGSEFDKHLVDADVVCILTLARLSKAPVLDMLTDV